MARRPKYVFRGTTIGYEGNRNCRYHRYTCTSKDPGKAVLFAMECAQRFPDASVVYIASTKNLSHLQITHNWNKEHEAEYIWNVPPKEFYALADGFVSLAVVRRELRNLGHAVSGIPSKENLNELCRTLAPFPASKMKRLLAAIRPFLQKN